MTIATAKETDTAKRSSMDHFVDIARRGKHEGVCSSGEYAARQLAEAIIRHSPTLDSSAISGAIEFLKGASIRPDLAEKIIH